MKKSTIVVSAAGVVILAFFAFAIIKSATTHQAPVTQAPKLTADTYPKASEVFTLVNIERTKAGLQPLVEDPALDASAAAKCHDEDVKNYHAHVAPDGTDWKSFIRPAFPTQAISENLAWDFPSSQATVNAWMHSPSHRGAILDSKYVKVGYAVCGEEGPKSETVQHFSS